MKAIIGRVKLNYVTQTDDITRSGFLSLKTKMRKKKTPNYGRRNHKMRNDQRKVRKELEPKQELCTKTTSTTALWCLHFSIIDCMTSSANFQVKVHEKLSCLRRSVPCVCVCQGIRCVCVPTLSHPQRFRCVYDTFPFWHAQNQVHIFLYKFFVGLVFISNDIMFSVPVSLWTQCTHAYNRRGFETIKRMHIMYTHTAIDVNKKEMKK